MINLTSIKRFFVGVAFLLVSGWLMGQSHDSICHHNAGDYGLEIRNMMELRDGGILASVQLFGSGSVEYGNRLYKLRYDDGTLSMVDSAFVEDEDICYYLLERNPLGDDNIYAEIVRDFDSCRSYLRIAFFDDDLVFFPEKEVVVPLEDTIVWWTGLFMIDPYNDIILSYLDTRGYYDNCFMRVGLDGTVKQKVRVPQSVMYTGQPHPLLVLGTCPLEFSYYGAVTGLSPDEFRCYTLDSLFQVIDTFLITEDDYFSCSGFEQMTKFDESTMLLAMRYRHQKPYYPQTSGGTFVAKYERQSQTMQKIVEFESDPLVVGGTYNQNMIGCARPFGLERAKDGNIYLAYDTQDFTVWPAGWVSIVKLNSDLEIIWQRYYLEPDVCSHQGRQMVVLENGGVAVGVVEWEAYGKTLSFIVVDDDGVSVPEMEAYVRPYAFYPNPVGEILHMEFSPDVTPVQVELYDLQGRLLRTQCNSFESIDMDNLPTGTYTLRVTLDDGMSYGDKVVKQ